MSKSERHLYEFGDFRLDASERLLSRSGVAVPLTPKAIDLLLALVAQPGRLLDKETLLNTVWPGTFVEENNLADNIFKLRRVLGDGENGSRFIDTVPKRGYRFVADVRAIERLTDKIPDPAPQVVAEPSRHAAGGEGPVALAATSTRRPPSVPWLVASAMTLLVVALGVGYSRRETPEPPRMVKASLLPPENTSFGDIALSPDGRWLAFTAASGSHVQLWLRSLTGDEANPVEGTDGASLPFWSPDSRFVGFFASGKLKKVGLGGGSPITVCRASVATGGTWNREGFILFTELGVPQISRVSDSGGIPEVVLRAESGQTDLHEPFFLPDGRRFLYLAISAKDHMGGIYVGSLDGNLGQ